MAFPTQKPEQKLAGNHSESTPEIMDILAENSSLQSYLPEVIPKAHQMGLDLVVLETPLDYADLPATPIYTVTQLLDPNFPEDLHPHPTCP
jgi:hypothetical protein